MTAYPFSALVGQDDLREALLACAVDPAIGGVLVRGERGTAKTTAVRGLAPLVGSLVELPIGATADRVLGTLDLDRALAEGASAFRPGLLAAAHEGLLYVDEVNLLPDHLVDVLLDAAALGRVHIERDGISTSYEARFLLVGTMNPEEGELRPQLLDRFGLSVEVAGSSDTAVRVEIVRRRLAFDADPPAFAAAWESEDAALAARVAAARETVVRLPDRMLLLIAGTCARLGVDGHRADIVCARAAKALAALDGAQEVDRDHVRRAARLALAHRRRRGPLQEPGLDPGELDAAMDEAGDDLPPDGGGGSNGSGLGDGAGAPGDAAGADAAAEGDAVRRDAAARRDDEAAEPPRGGGAKAPDRAPDESDARPPAEPRAYRADAPAPHRTDAPAEPGRAPLLALSGLGRGATGRRSRASGGGPAVDSRPPDGPTTDLALAATLRAAAIRRAITAGRDAATRPGGAADSTARRARAEGRPPSAPGPAGAMSAAGEASAPGPAGAMSTVGTASAPGRPGAMSAAGTASAPGRPGAMSAAGEASAPGPAGAARAAATSPARATGTQRRAGAAAALTRADLREHVRAGREGNLVVFCVDASGSMGARRRMARAKGAILGLLTDAYQRRDRVALVTFRGAVAQLVLPPTGSVERAAAALASLPTGGGTPLAAGLDEAARVIVLEQRRDPSRRALALVVTDGRTQDRPAALRAAQRLAKAAAGVVVFDGEQGPVRLGLARELAEAAGARLLPLTALETRKAA